MRSHVKAPMAGATLRRAAGIGAAAALLVLLCSAATASAAQRVELDQFCTEAGVGAGQCKSGEGIAVNRTGAGGVQSGDVYVVERKNERVQEFSQSGEFVRMWGKDVNTEGSTGFEVCTAAELAHCQAGASSTEAAALNGPRGIAIDQKSGNVYVANGGNQRIEVYSAKGEFEGAFGWNVKVTGSAEELQFCTTATGCQAGPSTAPQTEQAGAFSGLNSGALAVDPESGNLWVGDTGNRRINEFSLTLNGAKEVIGASFVRALGWNVNASTPAEELQTCTTATGCKQAAGPGPENGRFYEPLGLAVNSLGDIFAVSASENACSPTTPCRVFKFNPDGSFGEVFGSDTGGNEACQLTWTTDFGNDHAAFGIAVDPADQHVFLARKTEKTAFEVCEFDSEGTFLEHHPKAPISTDLSGFNHQTLALGNEGRIYVQAPTAGNTAWPIRILGLVPAAPAKVLGVSNVTTESATLDGQITVPKPGGQGFDVTYHFEYSADDGFTWARAPFEDASVGTTTPGTYEVHENIYGLQPNVTYRVRLVTTTSFTTTSEVFSFTTQKSSPTIVEQRPFDVTQTSASIQAVINPNGLATTYHFEFGVNPAFGIRIPIDHELFAGGGGGPVIVSASVDSLQERSLYYFRVVAINSEGISVGPPQRLETLNSYGLPDNRAPELITPADKGPTGSVSVGLGFQQKSQASVQGDSFVYPFANGLGDSTTGGPLRERAVRTGSGWVSSQMLAPSLIPSVRKGAQDLAIPSEWRFSSPDTNCGFVETFNPLTEDTPQLSVELGVTNLYRWNADGSYDLVTDRAPLNPEANDAQGGIYDQVEGADDCSRVFFQSDYELIPGASGLYEWDEGTLRDAGVLKPEPGGPIGTQQILGAQTGGIPAYAVLGGQTHSASSARWNAVSPNGKRMFFTAIPGEGPSSGAPAIFMRTDGGADVEEISASETAVPTEGARFEAASADGKRVFFRANYGIDAEASSSGPTNAKCGPLFGETDQAGSPDLEQKACDLYVYDVESGELTDLSAAAAAPGAEAQGAIAVSDDGSSVYFAVLGQLVPGKGRIYAENVSGEGSANVYLAREGEPLTYVTTLAKHDLLGPASAVLMHRGTGWDAATSADGEALFFASSLNLTGWGHGSADKSAAYLYSADTRHIACVSCRPDGLESVSQPAQSLLADPEQYQAYRPRSISSDGSRAYFSSPDVLATGAVSGEENVYQWEQGQVSFLGIADSGGFHGLFGYLGASDSGSDVFIASGNRMAPQDIDSLSDVYDLRVDGGFPPPSEPPPTCQVDESVPLLPNQIYCQGNPVAQPGPLMGGSTSSGGNVKSKSCPRGKFRRGARCLSVRQIAQRRCRGVKSAKARTRCVRRQMQKLNRTTSKNRGAAK